MRTSTLALLAALALAGAVALLGHEAATARGGDAPFCLDDCTAEAQECHVRCATIDSADGVAECRRRCAEAMDRCTRFCIDME